MTYSKLEPRQRWIGRINQWLPPLHHLPPKAVRFALKGLDGSFGLAKVSMAKIDTVYIPSSSFSGNITARVYYPQTQTHSAMVYFHGGGCVIGDLDTHDGFCRLLAHRGKQVIVAIDYRLAPEHKYPQPVYDAIDAWNWVTSNPSQLQIAGKKIGIGGDSAGGYFAATVGLLEEQQRLPVQARQVPAFQFLLYPLTDQRGKTQSHNKYHSNLLLTTAMVEYFRGHYLNTAQEAELPLVSPLLSQHLGASPRTYILTTEFDPLVDSGRDYIKKLQASDIEVVHRHLPDCMHQFISVTRISSRAMQACLDICDDLC